VRLKARGGVGKQRSAVQTETVEIAGLHSRYEPREVAGGFALQRPGLFGSVFGGRLAGAWGAAWDGAWANDNYVHMLAPGRPHAEIYAVRGQLGPDGIAPLHAAHSGRMSRPLGPCVQCSHLCERVFEGAKDADAFTRV
jgi:hypothetical protein